MNELADGFWNRAKDDEARDAVQAAADILHAVADANSQELTNSEVPE